MTSNMHPLHAAASEMLKDLARIPGLLENTSTMPLTEAIKEAEKLVASAQLIFKIAGNLTLSAAYRSVKLPQDCYVSFNR
jgi:hypothetical protein